MEDLFVSTIGDKTSNWFILPISSSIRCSPRPKSFDRSITIRIAASMSVSPVVRCTIGTPFAACWNKSSNHAAIWRFESPWCRLPFSPKPAVSDNANDRATTAHTNEKASNQYPFCFPLPVQTSQPTTHARPNVFKNSSVVFPIACPLCQSRSFKAKHNAANDTARSPRPTCCACFALNAGVPAVVGSCAEVFSSTGGTRRSWSPASTGSLPAATPSCSDLAALWGSF